MNTATLKHTVQNELDGQFFKRAVAGARLGVWDLDLFTKKLLLSDEMMEMLGFSKGAEPHLDKFEEQIHPDDKDWVFEQRAKHNELGKLFSLDYRIIRPNDGRVVWINITAETLVNSMGIPYRSIGTCYDVTRLKEAELRAEQADRAKTEFLGRTLYRYSDAHAL